MWSDKKSVDIFINTLLFLLGINFLHYGQLILPLICLTLFIDRQCEFHVVNIKSFILLCLFAISFCYFSYDLGFYCVMGFCLPMAYYIGSNLKDCSINSVKKIIYIIALGMGCHLILNFAYDFYMFGSYALYKVKHYDIWTKGYIVSTSTATNYVLIISSIYYLFFYEKNKTIKIIGILVFLLCMIYDAVLGRRMPVILLFLELTCSFVYDFLILKNRKINFKLSALILVIITVLIGLIVVVIVKNRYVFSIDFMNLNIIKKFRNFGLNAERLDIFLNGIKIAPYHLWGGQEISNILGIQIHDFWSDIYDYAGIITFILIVIYTLLYVKEVIVMLFSKKIDPKIKTLFGIVFFGFLIEMCIEPLMTGSSILVITEVIIGTTVEKLNKQG